MKSAVLTRAAAPLGAPAHSLLNKSFPEAVSVPLEVAFLGWIAVRTGRKGLRLWRQESHHKRALDQGFQPVPSLVQYQSRHSPPLASTPIPSAADSMEVAAEDDPATPLTVRVTVPSDAADSDGGGNAATGSPGRASPHPHYDRPLGFEFPGSPSPSLRRSLPRSVGASPAGALDPGGGPPSRTGSWSSVVSLLSEPDFESEAQRLSYAEAHKLEQAKADVSALSRQASLELDEKGQINDEKLNLILETINRTGLGTAEGLARPLVPAEDGKDRSARSAESEVLELRQWDAITKAEAKRLPFLKLASLIWLETKLIVLQMSRATLADCGSWLFWGLLLAQVPMLLVFWGVVVLYLHWLHVKKLQAAEAGEYKFAEGDVMWTWAHLFRYPAISTLAGVVAGWFGLGGGTVKVGGPCSVCGLTGGTDTMTRRGSSPIKFGTVARGR